MPPPTTNWSTFSAKDCKIESLVDTFEPPTIATNGRLGSFKARPRAVSSASNNGPAQATGAKRAIPCVVASARCAVPKASFTYTSHKAAICFESSSLFFFSPTLQRQFSKSTTSPGFRSTPSTQFCTSFTSRPIKLDRRSATGARLSPGLICPSIGRPKCDVTITAAPASRANCMAGTEARIRVSSVISPLSLKGTFKSERINTRLPFNSPACANEDNVFTLSILF